MPVEHTLVGWIPTILGRLSWTKIGAVDQRGRTVRLPRGENNYFIVRQHRRVADGLFPRLRSIYRRLTASVAGVFTTVEREFVGYEFNFYLVAKRAEDGSTLSGCIACVTTEHDPFAAEFDDSARSATSARVFPAKFHAEIEARACAHNSGLRQHFASRFLSRSVRLMRVEIARDGITHITRTDESEVTPEHAERVAQQSFYFLKDVSHVHQHHAESSECQFLLHPQKSHLDDKWAAEILKDLQRAVITARRSRGHLEDLYDSVGISNYAQSFVALCEARKIDLPKLAWDRLANSVNATSAKWVHHAVTMERHYTVLVAALALVVAFCGSYHILFAGQHPGSDLLTRNVLPPIAFLSHRLFEWDSSSWTNQLVTLGLWAGITASFVVLLSRTIRGVVTRVWHALVDFFVRAQFTSPGHLKSARAIAVVTTALFTALGIFVAKYGLEWLK